jgi:TPR repeat protein
MVQRIALSCLFLLTFYVESGFCSDDYVEFIYSNEPNLPKLQEPKAIDCYSKISSHNELRQFLSTCRYHDDIEFQLKLTQLATTLTSDTAICLLGRELAGAFGGSTDLMLSQQLFAKSASRGNLNAIYFLGESYELGRGVSINYLKAYVYLSLSRLRGFNVNPSDLNSRINQLYSKLSSADIERAIEVQGDLYFKLRQVDAMRFPSHFSLSIPTSQFVTKYC